MSNWDIWINKHDSDDQKKRLESSKKAECTPVSVDKGQRSGVFSGSRGVYNTTLEMCDCVDFSRRHLPCKHMYRLAAECGLIEATVITDNSKIIKPVSKDEKIAILSSAVTELEKLSENVQRDIMQFLHDFLYQQVKYKTLNEQDSLLYQDNNLVTLTEVPDEEKLSIMRKNDISDILKSLGKKLPSKITKKELYQWCLDNAPELFENLPNYYKMSFSASYNAVLKKLYTYLLRKYRWECYMNVHNKIVYYPYGAAQNLMGDKKYYYPNDEITTLLTNFEANRCVTGFEETAEKPEDY